MKGPTAPFLITLMIYHWGLNHWDYWGLNINHWRVSDNDPNTETSGILKESGLVLPGGDSWIIYPGDGEVNSSIRLEAMRDGIVDYELLKMLAEKDEAAAMELARQVIYDFTVYETDTESFRSIRKQILRLLSED